MHIELNIDDSIPLSLKSDKSGFVALLRFQAALSLYQKQRLSLGKAAELAGYSRLNFIDKLRLEELPIFHYEPEMVDEMVESAEELLLRTKP